MGGGRQMDSITSQVLLALIGLVSTISTGVFSYLKYRDDIHIKQMKKELITALGEVDSLKVNLKNNDQFTLNLAREKEMLQARLDVLEEERGKMLKKIDRLEEHEVECNRELNRLKGLLEGIYPPDKRK